ncbi:MAG: YD repeat-containing protein, partial [Polyangiales bacterium]
MLADGLHGLSLSAHHRYEPLAEMLVLGDGSTMRGAGVPRIIERVAGGGPSPSPEVGDVALSRRFNNLAGVAVGPGGRVHFSERRTHRIWRVEEDGTLGLVAGTGIAGMSVAASPSTRVIRRIDGAGVIHRVAGNGERGDAANAEGDGLDALDAPLEEPRQVSFGPDGTLYFVDGLSTLRMIDTAGRLRTLNPRSTRQSFLNEDSTPLSQADFGAIGAFAIDHRGTLFVGNLEGVVFRIGADRRIFRIAGGGDTEFDRELGPNPALAIDLGGIRALAPSTDGGLWLVDRRSRVMRLIGGRLTFVSGAMSGAWPSGDGGPAAAATLTSIAQIAVDAEARLVIAEGFPADQIRRIRAGFGARRSDEWVIPSSDGTLRYIFDIEGRHLRSETSLTGALVHQFAYDDEGRLRTITDADENVIVIERSGDDITIRPTQGPATRLIDEDGDQYVDRVVVDGDEHEARFVWRDAGQLVGFTDRIGVVHEFDYDSLGRLTLDGVVGGATQRIEREGRSVTLTTGGGRAATWGSDGSTGERIQSYTNASGVSMERSTSDEGVQTTRYEDGSEIAVVLRPDELLGSGVSLPVSTIVRTPSGRQVEWALEQESTVTDGVLDERVTRIITGVGTPREALTRQRLAITADGGSVFEMTSAEGRQGTMVRNAGGELVAITQPGRFPVRLEYDDHGRLVRALQGPEGRPDEARVLSWALPTIPSESFGDVEVEDATGRSVRASFDGRGRADEVSDEVGAAAFGFDEAARSLTVTPPGRDAHEFNFDSRGFMSTYAPPGVDGSATEGTETFEFDDDGIPLAMNFAGSEVSVDVDNSFRGRGASFEEGLFSAVDFDANSDVSARRWVQPGGEVRVEPSYDGPLVTSVAVSGAISATFTPEYDSTLELIATEIRAGGETGSVSWTRDDDGLTDAMTMTTSSTNNIPLTLNPRSGDLTAMRSGGANSTYDIDGFGSLEGAQHAWPGGALTFGYSRDRAGRIEDITESGRADQSFDFDARGRLTSAFEGGVERYGYDYDANGNRIGWRLPSGTCEGAACTEHDEQDRLLRYGNGAAQVTYRYNGAGMRTERTDRSGTTRYDYDSLGHLNGVTLPGGDELSYLHDPSGSRTTRSVDGTRTTAWL